MDPPNYGYEYWKHYHSDCELVHVMWTDYCGILKEKFVPVETFDRMYCKHAYKLSNSDGIVPLTVSGATLTSLPDGNSTNESYPSCKIGNLIPDYDTLQPCIDDRRRATVFAKVDFGEGRQADAREILKATYENDQKVSASLDFQFVLRGLSDDKIHLSKSDGPAQIIVQKLAQALRSHGYGAKGLSIRSIDFSRDGVVTIALSLSDNLLEAVDNFYRVKRALQSIASHEKFRPSFFYASENVSGAEFSGTSHDVMCRNRLHCRLHLSLTDGTQACDFAAGIMDTEEGLEHQTIYAFSRPNWLTYAQRIEYQGDQSPESKWMTWGVRNSKTTINFPDGCESGRLEFGDIDCMANMYLVVAAIAFFGRQRIGSARTLENIPQGTLTLLETMRKSTG